MESFTYKHYSGIKKGLIIRGNREEIEITRLFSKFFLITFSRQGRFKTTDYVFAFLKPGENLRESFNMYNEVLLLFSPYTEFETRTMDFIDKTLQEFENRLDKVCIILISKDNEIESIIKQLNTDNKDSKIIVPFTYEELLREKLTEEKLQYKLRNYFYNRDLFALESPLKTDTYFFGRINIVQALYDKYSLGEQSGLFGLRKVGKTSVLYALERLIALRGGNSIYIDCQDTSVHKSRWNELLFYLVDLIRQKYDLEKDIISNIDNYTERDASRYFEKDLINLKKKLNDRRILLIFDEIEHITFKTSSTDFWLEKNDYINFWQTLRAIYHKDPSLFSFIIAGVNPLCIEEPTVNGYDNPIFGMLNPTYLELFSVKDIKEMISSIGNYMGLKFDEEIFSMLADDYGGHPFLIRHVCSLINKDVSMERPYKVTKYDYKHKKKEYDSKISSYIESIISVLKRYYPEEYKLLEILIIYGNDKFKEQLQFYENAINHLLGYGILKKSNGNYFVTIEAVTDYIKMKFEYKKIADTKEARWEEVTVHRNNIEESLRKVILMNLSMNFGKKNVKNKVLEIIDLQRKDKIQNLELNDIFKNELYLLDLKKIIVKNWDKFDKIFMDKVKFETFIDLINKMRIDAHAKTISDDDMALLRICFKWFEDILEDVIYTN